MSLVTGDGRGSVEKPLVNTSGTTGNVADDASASGTAATATNGGVNTGSGSAVGVLIPKRDGKYLIPQETLARPAGTEVDASADTLPCIRTPGGQEWIMIAPGLDRIFTTNILVYKPSPDSRESLHYVTDQGLRNHSRIANLLRLIKFYLCFSLVTRSFFLWPVKVLNMAQYHSLDAHLRKPPEYFVENAFLVSWDHDLMRHSVSFDPNPVTVPWPEKSTDDLVGEALGADAIISDPSHRVFASLTRGKELR